MIMNRKQIRKIAGFTFAKIDTNPVNWYDRACQFRAITNIVNEHSNGRLNSAYYLNMGLALEIILKAVILSKSGEFKKVHSLIELSNLAGISVTKDQECTLELLSEVITWSGRYPTPKTENQWDLYHDHIFEKHIVRSHSGNTHRIMANEDRFPNHSNYNALWNLFESEYTKHIGNNA